MNITQAAGRPIAEIAADAIHARCGHCWAEPKIPCDVDGMHLARFARARRCGILDGPDMLVVLDVAGDVFEPGTVIPARAPAVTP